jgi:hypothetical protein
MEPTARFDADLGIMPPSPSSYPASSATGPRLSSNPTRPQNQNLAISVPSNLHEPILQQCKTQTAIGQPQAKKWATKSSANLGCADMRSEANYNDLAKMMTHKSSHNLQSTKTKASIEQNTGQATLQVCSNEEFSKPKRSQPQVAELLSARNPVTKKSYFSLYSGVPQS